MPIHTRYLDAKDLDKIKAFVAEAPPYSSIYLKRPLADFDEFPGWWYGAFNPDKDDKLEGVACVEGTTGNIVGLTREALQAMATDRLGAAGASTDSDGRSHQLLGTAEAINVFWKIFEQRDNRKVVRDNRRIMAGCSEIGAESLVPDIQVTVAKDADFKLVSEFSAEHSLEAWGADPRRQNKAAHEERVRKAISSGKQLAGRQGPRPIFIAEMVELADGITMLDKVYVPKPFRRRKLIMGALASAAKRALSTADEVILFYDEDSEYLPKAAERAGFQHRETYRFVMLR